MPIFANTYHNEYLQAEYSSKYQARLRNVIHRSVEANPHLAVLSYDLRLPHGTNPRDIIRSNEVSASFKHLGQLLDQKCRNLPMQSQTLPHNMRFVWRRMRPSPSYCYYRCYIFINKDFLSTTGNPLSKFVINAWGAALGIHGIEAEALVHPAYDHRVFTSSTHKEPRVGIEHRLWDRLVYLTKKPDRLPGNQGRTFGCSR